MVESIKQSLSPNQVLEMPAFRFMGISARINEPNQAELEIGKLWETFTAGHFIDKIPEFSQGIVYTLYYNYGSKSNASYTAMVGCPVSQDLEAPEGIDTVEVPAGKYAMFLTRGQMPQAVSTAWEHINQLSLDRSFGFDWDVYGPKSQNQENSEVEIFVNLNK